MSSHTQEQIGDKVGLTSQGVGLILKDFPVLENLSKSDQSQAEHVADFTPPIYNVWKQQTKSDGTAHFGSSGETVLRFGWLRVGVGLSF